jgi:tRNA 2-thiouridine synthesizing protein A
MKTVIIGGVAGGATAAARLRRNDEHAQIVLIERGPYVSFANCGLPYHLSGVIADRERLLVATPELFRQRYRVDVRTGCEAIEIDRVQRCVRVRDAGSGQEYAELYDRLILSPGAEPVHPALPGGPSSRVHSLRNIPDLDRMMASLNAGHVHRAVVIGGGFIGVEVAENLRHRGLEVTLVEGSAQLIAPLDEEMAALVHQHVRDQGVKLMLNARIAEWEDREHDTVAWLDNGVGLAAELIVLAIGVRPETRLARDAGLMLGHTGGIAVNEFFQTSDPHIYALGDAIEVMNTVSGRAALIPLAGPANRQGRMVADHVTKGAGKPYPGTLGTAILKVFDLTVASTGLNERQARAVGFDVVSTITHSGSHAGYYPGAQPISLKLVYTAAGRLLGAQAVGREGVDKRIDVIATALQAGWSASQLADLELAYAPPFGSAKDPVNIAGYVAGNTLDGSHPVVTWQAIRDLDRDVVQLIDVRTAPEVAQGSIPGARHWPLDTLRERLHELDPTRGVVVFCQVGLRGYLAGRILMQHGFTVHNLTGGYRTWSAATTGATG